MSLYGCGTITGAAIGGLAGGPRGAAIGAVAGMALIDAPMISAQQRRPYYPPTQNCYRDQWGREYCQQSSRVFYNNPPFYPNYPWRYWYTDQSQPGFVFFFGNDGRNHRHQMQRQGFQKTHKYKRKRQ